MQRYFNEVLAELAHRPGPPFFLDAPILTPTDFCVVDRRAELSPAIPRRTSGSSAP